MRMKFPGFQGIIAVIWMTFFSASFSLAVQNENLMSDKRNTPGDFNVLKIADLAQIPYP